MVGSHCSHSRLPEVGTTTRSDVVPGEPQSPAVLSTWAVEGIPLCRGRAKKTRNKLRGGVGFEEELGKGIFPHVEVQDPQRLGGLKEGQALVSILKSLSQAGPLLEPRSPWVAVILPPSPDVPGMLWKKTPRHQTTWL